jgi:hypothetical protein
MAEVTSYTQEEIDTLLASKDPVHSIPGISYSATAANSSTALSVCRSMTWTRTA